MADGLRILHLADSHIGAGLPRRPRVDRPRRGHDIVASYRTALAQARTHDVDLVIHAGDVFDTPRPTSAALAAAAAPLLELAAGGIPIVIVPGNHERSAIPCSLLMAHPHIHILAEPGTRCFRIRGQTLAVTGLPCIRRQADALFADALKATDWERVHADWRILTVHQTFDTARCGPANYRFRSGDNVVERSTVPRAFHYVAAGHIHRHQVLHPDSAGPPIVYAGSPDRISFAERDEPKGCVLIETNGAGLTHRFLEHPVRPMQLTPIDVTGLRNGQVREAVIAALDALPSGAMAMLRLTGRAAPGALTGLRFADLARRRRPDALVASSTRSVEYESAGAPAAPRHRGSAFSGLPRGDDDPHHARVDALNALPKLRGVYALYDADDRLLYIGKAANLRTRVQSHVRGGAPGGFFDGWTRQIARVEARPAHSELEALLVEADRIRRLRPPFNRRMRRWADYCYVVEDPDAHGSLAVSSTPLTNRRSYGPYRSRFAAQALIDALAEVFAVAQCPGEQRAPSAAPLLPFLVDAPATRLCDRYYLKLCSGPCAGRITEPDYAARLRARHALLRGEDETVVAAQEVEAERAAGADDCAARCRRIAETLRQAFDQGAMLRQAEQLRGGLVLLPGAEQARPVVLLNGDVRFDILDGTASAERVLRNLRRRPDPTDGPLSKAMVDACWLIVQRRAREPAQYPFLAPAQCATLSPADLLRMAVPPPVA